MGDELITIPLADFKQLAAELASEKASQVKQMQCSVAEPSRPMLKITKPTPIPVPGLAKSLAGALVIAAFPVARKYFKKVNLQRKKEKIDENVFFFVNTNVLIQGLEIGDSLFATESCDMLNAEFELDPKIEQFMIGEVAGIIDETIYQITVRVYPNKNFIYTADRFFLTPFVLLEEVKSSNWPKFDSQLIKRVSRQLIEKAYVKLKNSKRFKKISDFLNSDSLKR